MLTNKESTELLENVRPELESELKKVYDKGLKNIFFVGCGGTYSQGLPWVFFAETHSTLPVFAIPAAELMTMGHKQLGEGSLCLFASKSGDTKEIVEAMKFVKAKGADVLAILSKKECPMYPLADHVFLIHPDNASISFSLMFANAMAYICSLRGEFDHYDRLASQLYTIGGSLDNAAEMVNADAHFYAARNCNAPFHFVIGSGSTWGEAYCYAMCILEEMQWIRTKSIHAAEFFHGTIELVSKDCPCILLYGEDGTRPLMERAHNFLKHMTNEILVFDAKDVEMPLDQEFRSLVSPAVMMAMTIPLNNALQVERNHDLSVRRFYRQFQY